MKSTLIIVLLTLLSAHFTISNVSTTTSSSTETTTDSYSQVTYEEKHQNSSFMLSIGFLIASFAILWFNEARTVRSSALYSIVRKRCRSLTPAQVSQANSDTLIHFSDPNIHVISPAFDPFFQLHPGDQTIALKRVVELYQWKESVSQNRKDVGGGKIQVEKNYNYSRGWSEKFINSSNFKIKSGHQNIDFPISIRSENFYCERVKCCENSLEISRDQCQRHLTPHTQVPIHQLEQKIQKMKGFKSDSEYLFYQQRAENEIGSLRVSFLVNESKELSAIGVKQGQRLQQYFGDHGYSLLEIQEGIKSKDRIINGLESQNSIIAWILRLVGVVLMYLGFYGMFEMFLYYIRWIPILEPLLNFAAELIAGLLTTIFSLLTIAIAWVYYRPWLLALVVAGIAVIVGMIIYK